MAISNVPLNQVKRHDLNMQCLLDMINAEIEDSIILSGINYPAPIDRSEYTIEDSKILFKWYRDLIYESDIFIADISYPSTGLGLEMHIAIMLNKPIYLLINTKVNKPQTLTRMVHGIPNLEKLVEYNNVKSLKGKLASILQVSG